MLNPWIPCDQPSTCAFVNSVIDKSIPYTCTILIFVMDMDTVAIVTA